LKEEVGKGLRLGVLYKEYFVWSLQVNLRCSPGLAPDVFIADTVTVVVISQMQQILK